MAHKMILWLIAKKEYISLSCIKLFIFISLFYFCFFHANAQSNCDCPDALSCSPCSGGITSVKFKYTGSVTALVTVVSNLDIIYSQLLNPGDEFTVNSPVPSEKFSGNEIQLLIDGILNVNVKVNCPLAFSAGIKYGSFELLRAKSKMGGTLCCNAPPIITQCPSDIKITSTSALTAVQWNSPQVLDCSLKNFSSNYISGSLFPTGTTLVTYTAMDKNNNSNECSFNIIVTDPTAHLDILKVITPDGNGINDEWLIGNIENYNSNKVVVVDRWGSLIFKATGYNNTSIVWDGRNLNGNAVPSGTYFYSISIQNGSESIEHKGFIELLR